MPEDCVFFIYHQSVPNWWQILQLHFSGLGECLKKSASDPASFVSSVAHLGNIADRTGRKLSWDAADEKIVGDSEADKLIGVHYRKPWKLPYCKRT